MFFITKKVITVKNRKWNSRTEGLVVVRNWGKNFCFEILIRNINIRIVIKVKTRWRKIIKIIWLVIKWTK